jgi:VWFA-related protein
VSRFRFLITSLCSCVLAATSLAQNPAAPPEHREPAAQINLSAIGFNGLSASARLAAQSNMSLDFLDDDHVLLTFNPKKMFKRNPDCPPSHDDRLVHAVVMTVPEGKVVRETDWYLHDHQRYLWPLGGGRVLLRKLNSLYVVDSELHEKLLTTSPQPYLWIGVTGDGKQIITERPAAETAAKTAAQQNAKPDAKPKVKLEFLDVDTLAVQRTIKSEGKVQLDALSTGFADVIHGRMGSVWMVRFGPSGSHRENITRVRSRCVPDIMFLSDNTLLVGRCAMSGPDYSVSAFTLSGHFLWRQHWNEHRYTPRLKHSDDGSRVAVSSVVRVVVDASTDEEPDDDTDRGLKQNIQVLNTASGDAVFSLEAAPAVLSAQNVSLSPAGRRLALLQGSTLAVYDLPELSPEQKAKYLAVKADVPGLYAVGSEAAPDSEKDETTFTSVDAAEASAGEPAAENAGNNKPGKDAAPANAAPANSAATSPSASSTNPPAAKPHAAESQAAAATPGATATSTITFKSTPRIVVEDVVVTDSKGHSVKGLQKEDFQLTEDGKPQSVRAFEEFPNPGSEGTPEKAASTPAAAASAETAAPKLPPNIFTNNLPPGPETGSSTIIVLDLLNTELPDQERARLHLIDFIKKRPAASQMALCSLTRSLRLIQGFTRDETTLLAAVNGKKGGVKAPPWQTDSGLQRSVQLARDLAAAAGTEESILALERATLAVEEQRAQDIDMRMRTTLDAFVQLARYLSVIPGRKNLIWLSGSFPLSIQPNPDIHDYSPVTRNYESDVKKATNLMAEAHVAVYPVSAAGLVAYNDTGNNSEYTPSAMTGSEVPSHPGPNSALANVSSSLPLSSSTANDSRAFRDSQAGDMSTMDEVAKLTGGKAFYNTNGIGEAIDAAVEIGSHYYTLSYTPTNKNFDGGFRKVKVALEKKGYHVAYREGYYAQDPAVGVRDTRAPAQRIGVAAMQQGAPQSRQVVFSTRVVPMGKPHKVDAVQAGMAAKKKKNAAPTGPVEMQHYGIDYAVNPSDMRFGVTQAGLYHAVLGFMVTAFNDDGRLLASMESTTTSDLKPTSYQEVMRGGFRLHQELDVPTEAVSLRLGVEDATSSRVGTMEIKLPVPVPPEEPKIATRALPPIEPD